MSSGLKFNSSSWGYLPPGAPVQQLVLNTTKDGTPLYAISEMINQNWAVQ